MCDKITTEKRREMSIEVYKILNDTRLNAESLDDREVERMSYFLVDKIVNVLEAI